MLRHTIHSLNKTLALTGLSAALATGAAGLRAQEPIEVPHPATEAQTDQEIVVDRSQLPEGFPTDVPLYPAMLTPTVARSASNYTVRGQTPDSGVSVARGVTDSMTGEGWQRVANDRNPSEHRMTFAKGSRRVDVALTLEDQVTLIRMEVPGDADPHGGAESR